MAVRKVHKELGRKGRKAIRPGPMPVGRDSEEKGDYMGGDPPWEVSGSSHTLGVPALGSDTGKINPFQWLEG